MRAAGLFLFALLAISSGQSLLTAFSTTQTGDGTYYGGNDAGGNCGIYPLPAFATSLQHVALNNPQYSIGTSGGCGMCAAVSGIAGQPDPLIVFVNDRCPECATGALDLGWSGDGRFPISWKAVDCPTTGGLQYMFQGSNPYYIKVQVQNHKIPISNLELQNKDGSWVAGTKTQDNFWEVPGYSYPVSFPLAVRVTGINNAAVLDSIPSMSSSPVNGVSGVQLSGISSSSSVTVTPTQAPSTPTSAPVAPTSAPVASTSAPTSAPVAQVAPTTGTCQIAGASNSVWYYEVQAEAGVSVSITCSGVTTTCTPSSWGDASYFQCRPSQQCSNPVPTCSEASPNPVPAPVPVPVPAPVASIVTATSCTASLYGTGNNDWWNAVKAPAGVPAVAVVCTDPQAISDCKNPWTASDGQKVWQCQMSKICKNPQATCPNPSGARLSDDVSSDSPTGLTSWQKGLIGLGAAMGFLALIAIIVGLVVRNRSVPSERV